MIDYFVMAAIGGRRQQARLLLPAGPRDRMKEEDAFYNEAGNSFLIRLAAWLTLAADNADGCAKVRPDEAECRCEAACITAA
ncbi:hypothetical protein FHX08_002800 [Rhizobium sp. BK529]|uniref:hypothetical protein n=1 Tax=unclassified Rhizobium TaxID=2613769 RepID=UPI0010502FBF|nr:MULTISPECIES: hypothetical protein [unclassified Rhizobium]MBB3592456.1 hypothetical protein [Rhizobium sp. BK529]TCS06846.1 hypothetical protein EV281_102454 [Rhizobium sp. BK418]